MSNKDQNKNKFITEFDKIADSYYEEHKKNIAITGEDPDFFSEYKIKDLRDFVNNSKNSSKDIFDFGCGIGNSLKYFRDYFPDSNLSCGDVSYRSIEIAKNRNPGLEQFIQIDNAIPVSSESIDIVFSACVFHHIKHEEHSKWLTEISRITRKGGLLVIYEHNPLNPLTVNAVNKCPIDVNAKLIRALTMKNLIIKNGWKDVTIEYKLFFPSYLKFLRPLEKYLKKFFLGAQWRLIAKK